VVEFEVVLVLAVVVLDLTLVELVLVKGAIGEGWGWCTK
jgi:hypothetical protein